MVVPLDHWIGLAIAATNTTDVPSYITNPVTGAASVALNAWLWLVHYIGNIIMIGILAFDAVAALIFGAIGFNLRATNVQRRKGDDYIYGAFGLAILWALIFYGYLRFLGT